MTGLLYSMENASQNPMTVPIKTMNMIKAFDMHKKNVPFFLVPHTFSINIPFCSSSSFQILSLSEYIFLT